MLSSREQTALRRALDIAGDPAVPLGPNPRVGCVLLDASGTMIGEGHHHGAGSAHAEVDALHHATAPTTGATAVVTLEPCDHHGRTGPCTQALLGAGVGRVIIARRDPNPQASGGIETLRAAGVEVVDEVPEDLAVAAAALNRGWEHGLLHGRPLVTAKLALTLDGRVAAADGTSRWITGESARAEVHQLREACDVVLVGGGTARTDRPSLTARRPDGTLAARQPLRAVQSSDPELAPPRIDGAGEAVLLSTRNPHQALAELFARGHRHVLLEGGPTLLAAYLRARLVDELIVHLAPTLLGDGPTAVTDLGITTIAQRLDLELLDVTPLTSPDGRTDLRLTLRPRTA